MPFGDSPFFKDLKATGLRTGQRLAHKSFLDYGIMVAPASDYTPGKLVDMVIFAADPHDTDPDQIKNIPVLRTVVGGNTVFEA